MLYDATAKNPCFPDGRPPAEIHEILSWARQELGLNDIPQWRLISARRKLGRILFEIEEDSASGPRRLVGKVGDPHRAAGHHETLKALRAAGFAPPALYTVPEPVGFIASRGFLLQEKATGKQAIDFLVGDAVELEGAARQCADWLTALHSCSLEAPQSQPDGQAVWKWTADLMRELPCETRRIRKISDAIFRELGQPATSPLPSHGDFHMMNIFINGTGEVTGIDIDKFGFREPESDLGWFLMQTAAFGYFETGSFDTTREARRVFLEHYQSHMQQETRARRLSLYIAMAFLKNLHFELVLLTTGRTEFADPWLTAAASAILENNLHFNP